MRAKIWTKDDIAWAIPYLHRAGATTEKFYGEPQEFNGWLAEAITKSDRQKMLNALRVHNKTQGKASGAQASFDPASLTVPELLRLLERAGYVHGQCYLPGCDNSTDAMRPDALFCSASHKSLAQYRKENGLPRDGGNVERCTTAGCYESIAHKNSRARFCDNCIRDHKRVRQRNRYHKLKAEREQQTQQGSALDLKESAL